MPPVADRLEHAIEARTEIEQELQRAEAEPRSARKLGRTIFWLTVTGVSLYLVAPSLIETFGSDHVFIGTDYPFDMAEADPLAHLASVPGLPDSTVAAIAGGNAKRLLRI